MATETHRVENKRGTEIRHIKSNNPARNNTIRIKPTAPPSAGNFGTKSTKTQYHSVATGQRVSASGRKLSGSSALPKALGVAPQGRAAKVAVSRLGKGGSSLKLPKSDKRTTGAVIKAANRTPVLVAEFMVAMVIVGIHTISRINQDGYQKAISNAMLRFSAVVALWFVLFLLSSSKKGSLFAAWFGGLLVLGILFDAAAKGTIADFGALVRGQPLQSGIKLVDAKKDVKEFYATAEANPQSVEPGENV